MACDGDRWSPPILAPGVDDEEKRVLVVHGSWLGGAGLAIWAEDSTRPTQVPRRPGRAPRERPHPFAAGPDALGALLGDRPAGTVLLTLPTRAGAPLHSPELVPTAVGEPARGPVTLAGWRTSALWYAPDDALALLGDLDGLDAVVGAGLRHLARVVELAVDLVARGRLLPGVADPPPGEATPTTTAAATGRSARSAGEAVGWAVWRPLLTGADAAWVRSLALALPPAVRAASDDPVPTTRPRPGAGRAAGMPSVPGAAGVSSGPGAAGAARVAPGTGAGELVADALDLLTDAAARRALAGTDLVGGGRRDGVTAGWLAALTGPHRRFTAGPTALATLRTELDAWQRDAVGGPVRASFRLVEPADDEIVDPLTVVPADPSGVVGQGGRWRVAFGLQAADEPGLHVAAGDVWRTPERLPALAGRGDDPQETLLAELGRAGRLWPELDEALRTPAPEQLDLDVEGAHRFLRDGAPVLHAAGFGVLLPSWWQRPSARLGTRLQARSRTAPGTVAAASALGLDALVDYRWEVALGDETIDADELAALAALKTPLVRLRGRWVELDPKRLAAGLRLLRSAGELTVADLLKMGLAGADRPDALPVLAVTADGPLGDLLAGQAERRLAPLDPPPAFQGTLRPYQRRGLAWLAFLQSLGLGGVLADDMGLGKTVQLLALLAGDRPDSGPTLLVCPMSLVGNWQREAARFTPDCASTCTTARTGRGARSSRRRCTPPTWCSPPTRWPPGTPSRWLRSAGTGWWSTRPRRSRTRPPGRPRRSGRCPPGTGSRSPVPRWRTGWPTSGRSCSSPIPVCSARRAVSGSRTRCRSSGTATPRPRPGCAGSPARSCCVDSRPTPRSSPTCRRSWRWRCSAT